MIRHFRLELERRIEEQVLNRVSVEVTTAVPLDPALRKRLSESLEKFTGKSVRLEPKVADHVFHQLARAQLGHQKGLGLPAQR